MEPRISLVTLGVADLARAVAFYESVLGWNVAASPPGIAVFELGGLVFALYPHEDLAHDMGLEWPIGSGGYEGFALAHNLPSAREVDALFEHLQRHGTTIVKPPRQAEWGGYSGDFADPDGHKWEVAYNPFWSIRSDGRITLSPP
jgi:hypothetical protein